MAEGNWMCARDVPRGNFKATNNWKHSTSAGKAIHQLKKTYNKKRAKIGFVSSSIQKHPPIHLCPAHTRTAMANPRHIHMCGIPISFPHTPYRAQSALMYATVSAMRTKQHALLESPTGTGKSLALLCAALAFQQKAAQVECNTGELTQKVQRKVEQGKKKDSKDEREHEEEEEEEEEEDFARPKRFRDVSWQLGGKRKRTQEREHTWVWGGKDKALDEEEEQTQDVEEKERKGRKKVPRVFYATRTHKQVAHVVAELKKTVYRPRLCVLASRREYCMRDEIREMSVRDELCKNLVKKNECEYWKHAQELALDHEVKDEVCDIEELVQVGKRLNGCAYYASHELYQHAQLILCPYGFLVDPIVRKARGICLKDDVVILDEAHNLENCCRESLGFAGNVNDIKMMYNQVDNLVMTGEMGDDGLEKAYLGLMELFNCLLLLVDDVVVNGKFTFVNNVEIALYEGKDLMSKLNMAQITQLDLQYWRKAYEFIRNYGDGKEDLRLQQLTRTTAENLQPQPNGDNHKKDGNNSMYGYGCNPNPDSHGLHIRRPRESSLRGMDRRRGNKTRKRRRGRRVDGLDMDDSRPWVAKSVTLCNSLLTTLEYLFANTNDFSLVVERNIEQYVSSISVRIICLNAAICFRELSTTARSIVVASGTLTPLDSFAGELGTNFHVCKSLPHIINVGKQLYVGVVTKGPGNEVFDGTFRGSSKYSFQDSLGQALIEYCTLIPEGVLVFFPSYRMMTKLHQRWRMSGVWHQLERIKGYIMVEPNERGDNFDQLIKAYETTAAESPTGALLFGVCRGKLSEGVDFRDATARAVIIVGIPFPYIGEMGVCRKRVWNDQMKKSDSNCKLQSGAAWYEMQAFRALNQALGRVVRHRYDYGAILLLDQRFEQKRVFNQLPSWTRGGVQRTDGSHQAALNGLKRFYGQVQQNIANTVMVK